MTIYIGIDVARRFHVAYADGKTCAFTNNLLGYSTLEKWTREIAGKESVVYGLEPTGHYYRLLALHLHRAGHDVRIVPGLNTKNAKQILTGSRLKTDAVDAKTIAWLLSIGQGSPFTEQIDVYRELRHVHDSLGRVKLERMQTINRIHRCLDHLFPELPDLICLRGPKYAGEMLLAYQTPQQFASLGALGLLRSWPRLSPKNAQAIAEAGQNSIGQYSKALAEEMRVLAEHLVNLNEHKALLMRIAKDYLLHHVPYGQNLLTVPSIGVATATAILGTMGNIGRFDSAKQALNFAGLNMIERSSGEHRSRIVISRQGSKELRAILYLAALTAVRYGFYKDWYSQLARRGVPKKAVVALSRKLLRVCYAVARDNKPFKPPDLGVIMQA